MKAMNAHVNPATAASNILSASPSDLGGVSPPPLGMVLRALQCPCWLAPLLFGEREVSLPLSQAHLLHWCEDIFTYMCGYISYSCIHTRIHTQKYALRQKKQKVLFRNSSSATSSRCKSQTPQPANPPTQEGQVFPLQASSQVGRPAPPVS